MTKNRLRHERAYAAGGRDACERLKAVLLPILPSAEHRVELARLIDNIRLTGFRLPALNAAPKRADE